MEVALTKTLSEYAVNIDEDIVSSQSIVFRSKLILFKISLFKYE